MNKRVTVGENMKTDIYNNIHGLIMDQRLRVAKENKFTIDVKEVDELLHNITEEMYHAILITLGVE